MKAVVFDPFSGASGDMVVASLLDLGAGHDVVKDAMTSVAGDVEIDITKTNRLGLSATKVDVMTTDAGERKYTEIVDMIKASELSNAVISDALGIFDVLAEAEARVHNVPKDQLHFHEVGAIDVIADVLGTCAAFHDLELGDCRIYSMPVSVGGGFVDTTHGKLPVPAPATLEILRNSCLIYRGGPIQDELLTPTGAAILAHFVQKCDEFFPQICAEKIGYGAGSKDLDVPNVLRVVVGEVEDALVFDQIEMLETNVDDISGEILGSLIDELMRLGARDAAVIPAMMKKGRPGHIIQVIAKSEDVDVLARKIVQETGSLGVRIMSIKHRLIAKRRMDSVTIDIAGKGRKVGVKIATDTQGNILDISAEFEDCKKVAMEAHVPVREVIRKVEEIAWSRFS
ncbi:MAG: nickel pincer cofactor biosynthesis protein LarC [Methanocellales archaeon]|nr:nickel pincer cofactor biosynthesis protein LarC [Methanocellales archaeon]